MVARINTSKSISKALNYNEQKVQLGKAELLIASGFIKDSDQLNFYDKITHFERHISLNERATTNTLHLSLNFDPADKLTNEKMKEIAETYMEKIGFGNQPFLVYRHQDAGHPHLHIVSTNIEKDGKRISMHNLGRGLSEKSRKSIEIDFNLTKASDKKIALSTKLLPVNTQRVHYGKSAIKQAISNVLTSVINQYKYTSLSQLNAVLKLYNVKADRGSEDSRMYQKKGLTYRVLDEAGRPIGTPIKASAFHMKPTLPYLEKMFIQNVPLKSPLVKRIKTSIDWVLKSPTKGMDAFVSALEKEQISAVLWKGKADVLYGITYIDHKTKSVFNGSELGKEYSAKAIMEKCHPERVIQPIQEGILKHHTSLPKEVKKESINANSNHTEGNSLLLLHTDPPIIDPIPYQFKNKKKKKKRIAI